MSTIQNVLYFVVTIPVALLLSVNMADSGYYRHRVDLDWLLFSLCVAWSLSLVIFIWLLIK
jgi:hypothetical protein